MKSRGFTLLELLIVVIIIAILFIVGITQLSNTSSSSNSSAVASLAANLRATISSLIASSFPLSSSAGIYQYSDAQSGVLTSGILSSGFPKYNDLFNATIGNGNVYISGSTTNTNSGAAWCMNPDEGGSYSVVCPHAQNDSWWTVGHKGIGQALIKCQTPYCNEDGSACTPSKGKISTSSGIHIYTVGAPGTDPSNNKYNAKCAAYYANGSVTYDTSGC